MLSERDGAHSHAMPSLVTLQGRDRGCMALVTSGHNSETCGGREEAGGDPSLINMERNLTGLYGARHDWALGLTR